MDALGNALYNCSEFNDYEDEITEALRSKPDYESAATEEGWEKDAVGHYRHKTSDNWYEDARDLCENEDIEPHQDEIYEHYIVSDWLAYKLKEKGETVVDDLMGLTIWGRTCTGQSIILDYVICKILDEHQESLKAETLEA